MEETVLAELKGSINNEARQTIQRVSSLKCHM